MFNSKIILTICKHLTVFMIYVPVIIYSRSAMNPSDSNDSLFVAKYLEAVQSGNREVMRKFIFENYDSTFL